MTARLRVCMTADAVGGVWTYARDLARSLAAQDVAVTLIVLGPPPAHCPVTPGVTVIETGLALDWLAGSEHDVSNIARHVAALSRQADLVHLNSPALAAFGDFGQPVIGVCHSCVATWWDAVRGSPLPDVVAWRSRMLARGYAACDALVAPSASFAAATFARYGIRPRVVRNGCDMIAERADTRGRFVLTAGRLWDDGKNVADLEDAARRIDAPIVAAGPRIGPEGGSRVLRDVQPLGHLDGGSLRSWMNRAPIFASLALYEPFGLSVLEAARSGCALVLSDIPTFRELWDGAAIFVPARQPARLASALQRMLDAPQMTADLGVVAQAHSARYTVDAMTGSMLALYRAHSRQGATA